MYTIQLNITINIRPVNISTLPSELVKNSNNDNDNNDNDNHKGGKHGRVV